MIYAFLMIWVKSNALIQWRIDEGDQTILRIQKLHKKDTNWNPLEGYQLQKGEIIHKEASNQEIQEPIENKKILW